MIEELLMKVLESVKKVDNNELIFTCDTGEVYRMYHEQDCCEGVYIEDIVGDMYDIVGSVIVEAECVTNSDDVKRYEDDWKDDSFTWTFYKIGTAKGFVTIRWYGSSNGYYSEDVTFEKVSG